MAADFPANSQATPPSGPDRGRQPNRGRLAYLYSRFPVVSQTFCDAEMLALERRGWDLVVASLNPPPSSFRHPHLAALAAPVIYPPPATVMQSLARGRPFESALGEAVARHDAAYGQSFKAAVRARNAWALAPRLKALGVSHVHVHFANRATHTAWFLKQLGFSYSFTAHAQDFMLDLGSDELLRELCRDAEFVVAVSDYSRDLLARTCPDSADKISRIYNGLDLDNFDCPDRPDPPAGQPLRILSIGRLIEFKGFHHLVNACALLREQGIEVDCRIIGEGPWKSELESRIDRAQLGSSVHLLGSRSGDEVRTELARADVFALACVVDSKGASDILPTVITEAMASRLPVVSTRLTGVPEMVAHSKTGLLVPPGDEPALASALEQIARQPGRARELGEAGHHRAAERFSRDVTIPQLEARFTGEADCPPPAVGQKRSSDVPPRLVLVENWNPSDPETATMLEHDWRIIAKNADPSPERIMPEVDFYPEAVVLEACWLTHPDKRRLLDSLRFELGSLVDGETFFQAARRALWIALESASPPAAGSRIHAHRSTDVLTAWLTAQLSGAETSAVIEDPAVAPRKMLEELLPAFGFVSLADQALRDRFNQHDDHMDLTLPPSHRRVRLGPLRLKWRRRLPARDGRALALNLVRRLEEDDPS